MFWTRRHFLKSASAVTFATAFSQFGRPAIAEDGFLEISAGPSRQKLYRNDGMASDLWTYNGTSPGPEIRVRRGEPIRVRFTNNLQEPSSIHWHGIRIANPMDGVAGLTQKAVAPGETFEYDFVAPDAGTFWYHAHNKSWNQVGRGLYGPLVVEDDEAFFDQVHDLTLVIDDWQLGEGGVLDNASFGGLMEWAHGGRMGNWITVNGEPLPVFDLNKGEPYRLRLINAANARIFALDPNKFGARILAYDGQSLGRAETLTYEPFLLGPAQRADLLVIPEDGFALEDVSGDRPFAFATFRVRGSGNIQDDPKLPKPNPIPEPDLENARRIKLDMTGGAMGDLSNIIYQGKKQNGDDFQRTGQVWAFNGIANLAENPMFSSKAGETVIVEIMNNTRWPHAMHVHGHHFRVISRSASEIDDGKPWRDTALIGPEQTIEIAFVADNKGKWLFHCHMLEHAAAGMTTWFDVS